MYSNLSDVITASMMNTEQSDNSPKRRQTSNLNMELMTYVDKSVVKNSIRHSFDLINDHILNLVNTVSACKSAS